MQANLTKQLTTIPREIGNLSKLSVLTLSENPLVSIPPEVRIPSNLITNISKIGRLNLSLLTLRDCKLITFPPQPVCKKGTKFVMKFLRGFLEGTQNFLGIFSHLANDPLEKRFGVNNLVTDLELMLNRATEYFSDVTINVGSVEFPAHKIVLSARSKYFKELFEKYNKNNFFFLF
jgi:Leucine-rich repeat (LRR) protein